MPELPNLVALNSTGLTFRYEALLKADGTYDHSLSVEGKMLDPKNMEDLIAHTKSLLTTGKAAEIN